MRFWQQINTSKTNFSRSKLILFVVAFAGIGLGATLLTKASPPLVSFEPESGTILAPATIGEDANASGGKYVQFNATEPLTATSCKRPYTDNSPWNSPIVNATYSPNSQKHTDAIASGGKPLSSDGTQYTFPIYYVNNSTPRKTVRFKTWFSDVQSPTVMHNYRLSGSLTGLSPEGGGYVVAEGDTSIDTRLIVSDEKGVPVPDNAVQAAGTDAQLIIINTDTGEQWAFTNFNRDPATGALSTASLSHYNIAWNGVPPRSTSPPGNENNGPFRQIGAGISPLAGLIRPCEVMRAVDDPTIDDLGHALQFAYDYPARTHDAVCNPDTARAEPAQYLYPASQSDGSGCFPDVLEGTRLQLDPNISNETIQNTWGCRDACFVIAKTLQKYGMYTIDQSGRPKIRPEYEGTAKWTTLAPKYQVTDKTVNSIPWSAFKVVEPPAVVSANGEPAKVASSIQQQQTSVAEISKAVKAVVTSAASVVGKALQNTASSVARLLSSSQATAQTSESSFTFAAAGDHGFTRSETQNSLNTLGQSNVKFYLALGDFSYTAGAEQQWCSNIKAKMNDTELIAGNHDVGESSGGDINNYIKYCPFTLGSAVGDYGKQYYYDYPQTSVPLARFIMIAPGVKGSLNINYNVGGAGYNFTRDAIVDAKSKGIQWIIVGMHKNCISVGQKSCEVGTDIMNLLVNEKVDLVLQSHDHNYQRSHALKCITTGSVNQNCIADNGSDGQYAKGAGPVVLINGEFGMGLYRINTADSELGYFAKTDSTTFGITKYTVTKDKLSAQYLASSNGGFADSFSINAAADANSGTINDTVAPNTSLLDVGSNSIVEDTKTIKAAATDDMGITKVDFLVDGQVEGSDNSSPYTYDWNTANASNGRHTLQVKAYDSAGNVGSSSIADVAVMNCTTLSRDKGLATSVVAVPTTGDYRVWSRIMVSDATKSSYMLQVGNPACNTYAVGGTGIAANQWVWVDFQNADTNNKVKTTLSSGLYGLQLAGRDSGVKVDRVIATTDLNCVPIGIGDNCVSADTTAPSVSLTGPSSGSVLTGKTNITAESSDNIGVSKVEFLVDGVLKEAKSTAPYIYSWDTTGESNGSHTIQVRAYDAAGNVTTSNSISVTVSNDTSAPSAPASLTAAAGAAQVNLSWTAATDNVGVTKYFVQRNGVTIASLGNVTAYSDATVSAGTLYKYVVVAGDAAGNVSAASNQAEVTTPSPTDTVRPSTPANLSASTVSATQVNLHWIASTDTGGSGLAGYNIYRNGTKVATSVTTSFGDASVTPGGSYTYYVVAYDAAGNVSAASNQASTTTPVLTTNSLTVVASDDAIIRERYPSNNYGTVTTMIADRKPVEDMLMKYNVTGINGRKVISAKLRLYNVGSSSGSGGTFYRASSDSWSQATVTWKNAPLAGGSAVAKLGPVSSNKYYEVDLTRVVTQDSAYSFRVKNSSTDGADYRTRETGTASQRPQLIITVAN